MASAGVPLVLGLFFLMPSIEAATVGHIADALTFGLGGILIGMMIYGPAYFRGRAESI